MEPKELDPDVAEKILDADFQNIVKKVAAGKPLTVAERTRIESRAAGSTESTAYAKTKVELAELLGVSRRTLSAWQRRKGAPKPLSNGMWSVADWREFVRIHGLKGSTRPVVNEEALKARKLLAEVEERELRIAIKKGEFHWNALCAMSWGALAELYLRAKAAARKGDVTLLQQFYQKRLGLPWREYVEDYKLEIIKSGYKRGESWEEEGAVDPRTGGVLAAPLPERKGLIPLRFLTVDCQMDHLFLVVRSWSAEGSSRLVWNERVLMFPNLLPPCQHLPVRWSDILSSLQDIPFSGARFGALPVTRPGLRRCLNLRFRAVGLIFNTDDSSSNGSPGSDNPDNISLREGIDSNPVFAEQVRNQVNTPDAQDLFGTTIRAWQPNLPGEPDSIGRVDERGRSSWAGCGAARHRFFIGCPLMPVGLGRASGRPRP